MRGAIFSRHLAGATVLALALAACAQMGKPTGQAASQPAAVSAPDQQAAKPAANPVASDHAAPEKTGSEQVGKASIYSKSLAGSAMADGHHLDPTANVAASKTLPLGSTAKVTNLETGQSTVVKIEDRGPLVKGRVVDLSPAAAQKVGLTNKQGLAKVVVKPIKAPKPGADTELVDAKAPAGDTHAGAAASGGGQP